MAKSKIKKIVTRILIGILVLLLAIALVFKLYGNQLLRTAIIAGAQKALQVDVRLESIDVKTFLGKVDLKNMEIDNPEGYNHPTFVKMGRAYMDLNVPSLLSETIEIEKIQLDDIHLVIEQKGSTSNIKEILNNLLKSDTKDPESEKEPEPVEEKADKNVYIKILEINNIEVKAKLIPIPGRADTVTLKLKPIRLENLGTAEKIDMAGVTAEVLKAISKGIAQQGADILPTEMVGSLSKKSQEAIKDASKGAVEAVKGLGGLLKKNDEEE